MHGDRYEELLRQVLTGQCAEDDPEVQQVLARAPELHDRLRRMQDLAARLDRVGADDRQLLGQAMHGSSPLEGELRAMLERGRRRQRRWRLVWPLAAAAAVLLLSLIVLLRDQGPSPADVFLGLKEGEMRPVGVVDQYETFEWNLDLPPGGVFEVRFFAGHDVPLRDVLLAVNVEDANQFTPDSQQRRLLPDDLQWQVLVLGADGLRRSAGLRSVRRKP